MKTPNNPTTNETRDLPACSRVPQPTATLHTIWPFVWKYIMFDFRFLWRWAVIVPVSPKLKFTWNFYCSHSIQNFFDILGIKHVDEQTCSAHYIHFMHFGPYTHKPPTSMTCEHSHVVTFSMKTNLFFYSFPAWLATPAGGSNGNWQTLQGTQFHWMDRCNAPNCNHCYQARPKFGNFHNVVNALP